MTTHDAANKYCPCFDCFQLRLAALTEPTPKEKLEEQRAEKQAEIDAGSV